MDLVAGEIAAHDWATLTCGCGLPATHLPDGLLGLANATAETGYSLDWFQGHVMGDVVLYEPALPVVSVALAALADDISPTARLGFLKVLFYLSAGEAQPFYLAEKGRDLLGECIEAARRGLWMLYAEVLSADSVDAASYAYEILSNIEDDTDRLDRAHTVAGDRLAAYLR